MQYVVVITSQFLALKLNWEEETTHLLAWTFIQVFEICAVIIVTYQAR